MNATASDRLVVHHDAAQLRKPTRTPDGYLKADATVTRTGVFTYLLPDGTRRRELRHPDEVFRSDSLITMAMIPLTLGHPGRLVSSETARQLQVGATGENIRKDGRWVICPIVITDAGAVGRIDNGECRQVSLGYETELVPESGTYDGESYDYRQTNIRYNHLALVSRARAGDEAIVHLDAADGVMQEVVEPVKETVIMSKIRLDGIEYDAAPEVLNHIERLTERTGAAEKTAEELELEKLKAQEAADAAAGEKDAAKAELEKLKATSNDEAIRAGVKARVALERTAAQVLGTEAKLDAMNDRDIKVAVVTKVHADAKMDGRSDEYVQARFDAAIEVNSKINAAAVDTARKVLNPVKAVNADELDATAARARMIENQKNAHKGGGAK